MANSNQDIIGKYVEQIQNNVQQAISLQKTFSETAKIDENGDWIFTAQQSNDFIYEDISIRISKDKISLFAPEDELKNKSAEMAHIAVIEQAQKYKTSSKTPFEYYKSLNDEDRHKIDEAADLYSKNTPDLQFEATKQLLLSNAVMPRIVNRALQQSATTAKQKGLLEDSQINSKSDNGYCTKSLFIPLYEFQDQYGGFNWLPKNAETASHPQTMINHIKEYNKDMVSDVVNLNSQIVNYDPGAIVLVDQGKGHMHAMMYNGINQTTSKPQYIGFNSNDLNRGLSDKRVGVIIDLPKLIQNDDKVNAGKQNQSNLSIKEDTQETINIAEKPSIASENLSRGQKAEYVNLQINRVRKKLQERNKTTTIDDKPHKTLPQNIDKNILKLYQDSRAKRF